MDVLVSCRNKADCCLFYFKSPKFAQKHTKIFAFAERKRSFLRKGKSRKKLLKIL